VGGAAEDERMSGMTYDEMAYSELIDACEEKDARIEEQDISLAASAQAYETALARIKELEEYNREHQKNLMVKDVRIRYLTKKRAELETALVASIRRT
jgi:hypothetical protein